MTGKQGTHLVFVAGLSGSGKSTATAALEDSNFYCVDNLPAQLVPQFLDLCSKVNPPISKIAVAVDTREEPFLRSLPSVVATLKESGAKVEVIFLDCANDVLEKRYRETRRVHPLSPLGRVDEGIEAERRLLVDAASIADVRLDTSDLNVHQLKDAVVRHVSGQRGRATVVNLLSFGFRYGTPQSTELLFDVRFLPNPYFEPSMRELTGLDERVARYVLDSERGRESERRLRDYIGYVLPLYDEEGKAYVTIGIGCTGGCHRSVAMVERLAEALRKMDREVNVEHRDVERG